MEKISTALLYLHIACGSASLITFWVPVFTKKGNSLHRIVGKVYVYLMAIVVATAAILSIENAIQGDINTALFLGFLSVLSGSPLWQGVAILKNKRDYTKRFVQIKAAFSITLFLFGVLLVSYGLFIETEGIRILMFFFGFFGLTSIRDIIRLVKAKPENLNWYQEHYKGMIVSGIAAYTAFLAFGGRQFLGELLPGMWQILPWIAPTLIGVAAMRLMDRYYTQKGIIKKPIRVKS